MILALPEPHSGMRRRLLAAKKCQLLALSGSRTSSAFSTPELDVFLLKYGTEIREGWGRVELQAFAQTTTVLLQSPVFHRKTTRPERPSPSLQIIENKEERAGAGRGS